MTMEKKDTKNRTKIPGVVNTVFFLIVCIFGFVLLAPFVIAKDINSIIISSALIGCTFIAIIFASSHIEKQSKELENQITELEGKRKDLEYLVDRNSKIEDVISSLVSMFMFPENIDNIIMKTLERTATLCSSGSSSLYLYKDDGSAHLTHHWTNTEEKGEKSVFEKTSFSHFPWIEERLKKREMVLITDDSKLLDNANRERKILQSNGLHSIFILPVESGGELAGFVSVENHMLSMECCNEYTQTLKIVSELVSMALNHKSFLKDISLFRDLINRSNDFIFVIDRENDRIIDVNETACQEFGYSREEFLEMEKEKFGSFFDNTLCEDELQDMVGDRYFQPEKILARKDGTTLPAEMNVTFSTIGGYSYALAVVRDITIRKEMETEIAKTKEVMELALDGANLGMWDWNLRTNEVMYNERWGEMLGYDAAKIEPSIEAWKNLVHPADMKVVNDTINKHLTGEIDFFESEFRMKNSREKWQWILARGKLTEWDKNSEPFRFTGTTMDLDERKKVEEELRHSNELKDLFTDIMRHDLLNPVGNARGFSEVLLEMEDDESKKHIINTMLKSINKVIDMIETAAKFAKLESQEELEFMKMDIMNILNSVTEHFYQNLREKNMVLEMRANGSYPCMLNPIVEEIFANYISNAIKYSPENTIIVVDIEDCNYEWKVKVSDFGEGISDASKPLVFDRFKRVDKSGVKGTGLGLAIVKKIAELLGGSVGVEDNPEGQGSVFWVKLKKDRSSIQEFNDEVDFEPETEKKELNEIPLQAN
ncbi:MAG: PAS domain S-box protein [Methanolobus sp.]